MAAEIWKNGGNHSAADTSGGAWLRSVQKNENDPVVVRREPLSAIKRRKFQGLPLIKSSLKSPAYTLYNICIPYHPLAPLHNCPAFMVLPLNTESFRKIHPEAEAT